MVSEYLNALNRFRANLRKLKVLMPWSTGECSAPSPPWCAQREPGVFTTGWWQDSRGRWALPQFGSASTTPWNSSTLEAQRVSLKHLSALMNEVHLLPHWHRHPCCPDAGIVVRLMAGCTTGAMAVAFAQPTDVVKVRFQAQVRLTEGGKRYNGTMDAYKTIARDEGLRGLWKGSCLFTSNFNST